MLGWTVWTAKIKGPDGCFGFATATLASASALFAPRLARLDAKGVWVDLRPHGQLIGGAEKQGIAMALSTSEFAHCQVLSLCFGAVP